MTARYQRDRRITSQKQQKAQREAAKRDERRQAELAAQRERERKKGDQAVVDDPLPPDPSKPAPQYSAAPSLAMPGPALPRLASFASRTGEPAPEIVRDHAERNTRREAQRQVELAAALRRALTPIKFGDHFATDTDEKETTTDE
jgi:hypothetical protein